MMITFLSVVTSVKDYVDVVHTIMDRDPMWTEIMTTYFDPGAIFTFCFLFCKELFIKIFTFGWLPNFATLPSLIPEVTRSMLTELSVFDTPALRFPNMFTFLETPISYGPQNIVFYSLEKFIIGLFNSLFFCLPTSFAHIVCMRRFVMQGVEAGYLAGLGTIAGNLLWISCIVLGFRAIVIPWISLDMLRYAVGTVLVFKYLWDSYRDRRVVLTPVDELNVFFLNFCLAFLEQSMVFPFISNLSIGSDATLIESFPTGHIVSFFLVHFAYLGGLLLGSLTLLQGACWFWENPAFSFYMWAMSTFKMSTLTYYRLCNFLFLYASMFFAMANLVYFGTDYLVTKPLGYVPNDRLTTPDYAVLETSYLGSTASSRNTRLNEGRHNRRERWKRRHKKFRMFDAALYDNGIYDLFTIEDLNYGFHKFWLRRKMRNHKANYRILPAKQVKAFKREAARAKLENFMGPRFEFTRMLFENAYHPTFHQYQTTQTPKKSQKATPSIKPFNVLTGNQVTSVYAMDHKTQVTEALRHNNSALRKFVRKLKLRMKGKDPVERGLEFTQSKNPLYSRRWRHLFSRIYHRQLRRNTSVVQLEARQGMFFGESTHDLYDGLIALSERERQLLRYQTYIKTGAVRSPYKRTVPPEIEAAVPTMLQVPPAALTAVHPLAFYLKREEAFKRKLEAYGPSTRRAFKIGANLHVFNTMSKRLFYYHKPTNRWERGMTVARVTRKRSRSTRYQEVDTTDINFLFKTRAAEVDDINLEDRETTNPYRFTYPTDYTALISKRAARIRHQIFKDVLQHWYYSPYNRFLLQWDMDSFIRRQPRSHFMNKEDEKQLHLRRFLLNDYFQTFRWYARMEQYHIMKQRIGGTKSFRSRVYNQQFAGTFKKVRHLFAVTPTLETQPILKFDQPLFNEYPNTTKTPVTAQSFIHEELNLEPKANRRLSRELWDQTAAAVALAFTSQALSRENFITLKLSNGDTDSVTRFILRGKKNRGVEAASGSRRHLRQEARYLKLAKRPLPKFDPRPYVDELWLHLLDRAADYIYDEDTIKEAIEDWADEVYEDEDKYEDMLDQKIERLKEWIVFMNTKDMSQQNLVGGLTHASSLAIKDVLYFQNDLPKERSNRRKSRTAVANRYKTLKAVKKVLKRRYQQRFLDNLKAEQNTADKVKKLVTNAPPVKRPWFKVFAYGEQVVQKPVKVISTNWKEFKERFVTPIFGFITKPFRAPADPDFDYWIKREEAFELSEDVLNELDDLRQRRPAPPPPARPAPLPPGAIVAEPARPLKPEEMLLPMIMSIRDLFTSEKRKIASFIKRVPVATPAGFAKKKAQYEKRMRRLNRRRARYFGNTKWQKENAYALKFLRRAITKTRKAQRADKIFYQARLKADRELEKKDWKRRAKAFLERARAAQADDPEAAEAERLASLTLRQLDEEEYGRTKVEPLLARDKQELLKEVYDLDTDEMEEELNNLALEHAQKVIELGPKKARREFREIEFYPPKRMEPKEPSRPATPLPPPEEETPEEREQREAELAAAEAERLERAEEKAAARQAFREELDEMRRQAYNAEMEKLRKQYARLTAPTTFAAVREPVPEDFRESDLFPTREKYRFLQRRAAVRSAKLDPQTEAGEDEAVGIQHEIWKRTNREREADLRFLRLKGKVRRGEPFIDKEVPMKVGVYPRIMGDIPWFPPGETPPEGEGGTFELQVPESVKYIYGGDLITKRDLYDTRRAERGKAFRKRSRQAMRAAQRAIDEEFAEEFDSEEPTILDRIENLLTGGVDVEEEDLEGAIPVEIPYGTMSLVDTNEEFIEERNLRKFELLDEYTRARAEGDPKAKEMQEKVLRSLTGKPNLKLEDPFVPLEDDEPAQWEVEGELNWWEEHKWPLQAELAESLEFHPATDQTEFENIAEEAFYEANRLALHRWWWQEFLPKVRNEYATKNYGRRDEQLSKALNDAAHTNFLEEVAERELRDERLYAPFMGYLRSLGQRDYKPLQTPQGAAVLADVIKRDYKQYEPFSGDLEESAREHLKQELTHPATSLLDTVTEQKVNPSTGAAPNPTQWVSSTPAPFYVGWDETARQFVVTNRYLSREQSGYQMNWNDNFPIFANERSLTADNSDTLPFSKYPLTGLSADNTVYYKVLFAAYDADQYFNLGLDGFTPIGWRKFKFRHTAPRVQPLLVHSVETSNVFQVMDKKRPFGNLVQKYVTPYLVNKDGFIENEDQGHLFHSVMKNVDSVRTHPQPPPFFPTGPLLTDILPTHYVFSLYQRYRLPKERYADVMPNGFDEFEIPDQFTKPGPFLGGKVTDFTLRKRPMPQRKYHSKERLLTDYELLPRRKAFRARGKGRVPRHLRIRRPGTYPTETTLAERVKEANEGRMRTLRRRVLRKTQRAQLRYPPVIGGFAWNGDALYLTEIENALATTPEERKKIKEKAIAEGRPVPPSAEPQPLVLPLWQPQARHLFIAEHNKKVLKRRLERTQNKAYYYQKLKFFSLQHDHEPLII